MLARFGSAPRRAWIVALGCAGCHWASGGFGHGGGGGVAVAECHQVQRTPARRAAPPAPADPGFARLLAFRPYYSLDRVGAYEHHFAVRFSCIEQSVDYYAVAPDGTVRRDGGAWGGLADGSGRAGQVPPAQMANARRVAAAHASDYVDASVGQIDYLGSYREVVVTERLPVSPPGDPYGRMMWFATTTLRADAGLTRLDGKLAGLHGGETRVCWRDFDYVPCGAPRWIDVDTPPSAAPDLVALVRDDSPLPAADRDRFAAVVLAAARDQVGDRPGASLDAILARQGDAALPPHLAPPIRTGFTIRPGRGDRDATSLEVPLSPVDAVHGTARGRARTTVGGVPVTAEVEASAVAPVAADARGPQQLQLRVRYRLTAGAGPSAVTRDAEAVVDVDVLVSDDAAVVTLLVWPAEATAHPTAPPLGQSLPIAGVALDARFGISIDPEPWWGPASSR
jgi:hypothetical protein